MEAVSLAIEDAFKTTKSNVFKLAAGYPILFFVKFNVIQLN